MRNRRRLFLLGGKYSLDFFFRDGFFSYLMCFWRVSRARVDFSRRRVLKWIFDFLCFRVGINVLRIILFYVDFVDVCYIYRKHYIFLRVIMNNGKIRISTLVRNFLFPF